MEQEQKQEQLSLELESEQIGPLPIVDRFVKRLDLERILHEHVTEKRLGRMPKLSHAKTIQALICNIVCTREPLYALRRWFSGRAVEFCGLTAGQAALLNDDRVARALDRFLDCDPLSLLTTVFTKAVQEFDIQLDEAHSDTTSVTFSGAYKAGGGSNGELGPAITYGHNKDHRPDLKQLVYSLTVSADGAVPVHHKIHDGNKGDDKTYLDAWCAIRRLRGDADFLFVADSKLCTKANLKYIAAERGRFLTVLPRSRREDDDFREQLRQQPVAWREILRERPVRDHEDGETVYQAYEWDRRSAEGYRIVWYVSSVKARHDEKRRAKRIKRARQRIEELEARTGAHRLRSVEAAVAKANEVLQEEGAQRWLRVDVSEQIVPDYKQARPGRPSSSTPYRRIEHSVILLEVEELTETIAGDALCDGLFAMVTTEEELTPLQLLQTYKFQSFLEKRNEQLKTVLHIAPVWLKRRGRVVAILYTFCLALLIHTLVERETRRQMKARAIDSLPLYPERRICTAPTTEVIFKSVAGFRRSHLLDDQQRVLRTFYDPLSDVARQVLELLDVDLAAYGH